MTEEKKIGGISLFNLWFGAAVSLAEIMTGSLLAPLGIKKGILIILLGHVIGTSILALVGVIGFKQGKPSLITTRMSLGRYGSYGLSVFNILQLAGWTAIMLIQCVRSMQAITGNLFGFQNFTVLVVFTGILVAAWALFADKGINIVNNIAVVLLLILSFVMLSAVLKGGSPKLVEGSISVGAALELSIVMPLTWVPLISDYTMNGKSLKGSFFGSFAGYFTGSSLMYIIGLVSAIYVGASDPIGVISGLNMGIAALFVVVFSTVTTTFMDVYSAVMSTLNLSGKISRKALIILFSILGILLALCFPMEQYENFLYAIGSVFAPAFSIVIVDYFMYGHDFSGRSLNVPGILSVIVGVAVYYGVTKYDLVIGSTIPSMAVSAMLYIAVRHFIKISGGKKYAESNI
jgi:probable hydroxymethylpyrimidine transporter CytX